MLIVKKVTRVEDGAFKTEFAIGPDQMNFLLTYAINILVAKGLAEVHEETELDAAAILAALSTEHLPRA